MGLDIYLHRHESCPKEAAAREEALEAALDERMPWSQETSDADPQFWDKRRALKAELAPEFGCNPNGNDAGTGEVRHDDPRYPDHYFKIGYCRSSYNEGGIDRLARNYFGVEGLYWIFDKMKGDDYYVQPDWSQAKERALDLARMFRERTPKVGIAFEGFSFLTDPEEYPTSNQAALALYLERFKEGGMSGKDPSWFSSKYALFTFPDPPKLLAVIPGWSSPPGEPGSWTERMRRPGAYVVFEQEQTEDGGDEWYARACEITAATCDYVLNSPDPEKHWLHWSA
jgi:hypothetical protein